MSTFRTRVCDLEGCAAGQLSLYRKIPLGVIGEWNTQQLCAADRTRQSERACAAGGKAPGV